MTVLADAGMMSEANLAALEDAGLEFHGRWELPEVPYEVDRWRHPSPNASRPTGMTLTQPGIMGPKADPRHRTIFYQYRPTGPAAPCTASTSRSSRPRKPSPGKQR